MPRVDKPELMKRVSGYIGEDNSDEALSLLEDIQDTIEDSSDVSSYVTEIEELKKKVEETETTWREKYKARFTDYTPDASESVRTEVDSGSNSEEDDIEPPSEEELGSILAEY